MTQPHFHSFSWDDLTGLVSLVNGVHRLADTPGEVDAAFMEEQLRVPGMHPETDCLLASRDGALAGYMLLNWELPIASVVLEGGVLPAHQRLGIGGRLFDWALERGRGAGAEVARAQAAEDDNPQASFLQRRGFRQVRRHEVLRWVGEAVPEPVLPPEMVLRRLRPGDEASLTGAQNAAFEGQWGFSPNTVEQISHDVHISRTTSEGVALLMDGDDVAAYCTTQTVGTAPQVAGSVLMLGVHPRYQGLGLGRASLLAAMRLLLDRGARAIELTVDAENQAAKRLYESVGFQRVNGRLWFEADLSKP